MDNYYDRAALDVYTDYLVSSFCQVTATGLSALLGGAMSHDRISRLLASRQLTSADLWAIVKPTVRAVQSPDGVLIIDDSIVEKPHTDESELVCWHWDHARQRHVKGINVVSALYHSPTGPGASVPVAFELVSKPDWVVDRKTGRPKRKARQSRNEQARCLLKACVDNRIPFRYVLADGWYASAENMRYIKQDLQHDFVMPLKANRNVALSQADRQEGCYVSAESLELAASAPTPHGSAVSSTVRIWLEGVGFPLLLCKEVFTHEDGKQSLVYLATSDTTLTAQQMATIYHRRWKVEEYHNSLKNNTGAGRSPTRTVRTQTNHLFASVCAFLKLEQLRLQTGSNHFALKARLYLRALRAAVLELQRLRVGDCSPERACVLPA